MYTVFRGTPPAVGFAELSPFALAMNGADVPIPAVTVGLPTATVLSSSSNNDVPSTRLGNTLLIGINVMTAIVTTLSLYPQL